MLPKKVYIRELGPREGFQMLPQVIPTDQKLALIELLERTGVPEIEITSFVRSDKVPQLADAEELVQRLSPKPGVVYTGLYLNQRGFARAEETGKLFNKGWVYLSISETFLKRNNNLTFDQFFDSLSSWIALFKKSGKDLHGLFLSNAFGCSYEGRAPHAEKMKLLRRAMKAIESCGAFPKELCLGDTVGMGTPEEVRALVTDVRREFSEAQCSLHLHDTRGMAIANAYAGMCAGVSILDGSVGGLGGCPFTAGGAGNVATEELVYLCEGLGVETGIDLGAYLEAAKFAAQLAGRPLPSKLLSLGDDE